MFHVRYDSKEVNKILGNTVSFSYGFLDGIDMEQIVFNKALGEFTVEALKKYIDSQARMNPEALHHVYEWDRVGDESARLFDINADASKRVIHFKGKFLRSKAQNEGGYVFYDKANTMENSIGVTIEPTSSDVLVFEDEGETVFTVNAIYIEHPGGDEVAGSFGKVVDEFFDSYFTNAFLSKLLNDLSVPQEYEKSFAGAVRGGSRTAGISAGKRYLSTSSLGVIE